MHRRGFAVISPVGQPGPDADSLEEVLRRSFVRLQEWARGHGLQLTDQPRCLAQLDQTIDQWASLGWGRVGEQENAAADQAVEVGLYLGHVLLRNLSGAAWELTEDGLPYVVLATGERLDVIGVAESRIHTGHPRLMLAFTQAAE